jgi:hypothetical protein
MIKPMEFHEGGVLMACCGHLTSREILLANAALIAHPAFKSLKYQLWIFENLERFSFDMAETKQIAEQDRQAAALNPGMRVAVVSDSELTFGFSRMYQGFLGDEIWQTRVFNKRETAEKWLHETD